MDSRCLKIMQMWAMLARTSRDRDHLAAAVYFGVMERAPPVEVGSISNAMDLCDFVQREAHGKSLTKDEMAILAAVGLESLRKAPRALLIGRTIHALPYLLGLLAFAAMAWRGFSWALAGTVIIGIFFNSCARAAAGKSDSSATFFIVAAWGAMLSTLVLTGMLLIYSFRIL